MEIEELKQNQNIIANKLIELTKESRKNRQDIEKDLEKIKDRDTKIAEQLTEAKKIVDTFSEYQRTFERTNFLNKVFTTIIFLFLIFLIWGSFLIYSQANHIKNLEKTISSNKIHSSCHFVMAFLELIFNPYPKYRLLKKSQNNKLF